MATAILSFLATVIPLALTAVLKAMQEQRDANKVLGKIEADELDAGMSRVNDGMHL